jgi:hypothetical protein
MKKLIFVTILLIPSLLVVSQEREGRRFSLVPEMFRTHENRTFFTSFSTGFQVGTDVGGAMPVPLRDGFGPNDKMNVSLRVRVAVGVFVTKHLTENWTVSLEGTRRDFGMSVLARVDEQICVDREADLWIGFRGLVHMEMEFPMWEFALLGRYSFENIGGRAVLGVYYARNRNTIFITEPRQGMLFNVVDGRVDFDDPISRIDAPFTQDFSDAMSKWDFGVLAGFEQQILFPQLFLTARVSKGFNDIFHPDHRYLTFNMRQIRGSFALSYNFRPR